MTRIDTILSVQSNVLKNLGETAAIATLRRILWAEVGRLGRPVTTIDTSLDTKSADGGIDASIFGPVCPDSVLSQGSTWFQVKAGISFCPWQKSAIENELWKSRTRNRDGLGAEFRRVLDSNGKIVLVVFGHDLLVNKRNQAIEHLRDCLAICGYTNPTVDVWGTEHLLGFIQRYPSLCLELNGRSGLEFFSYQSWHAAANMQHSFCPSESRSSDIRDIRAALTEEEAPHIRVIGEPGIGKTRLVLEALKPEELSERVVYCSHAEQFRHSQLLRELLRPGSTLNAIVVLDDCSAGNRAEIWNLLKSHRRRLALITLSHDQDHARDESMISMSILALPEDSIQKILDGYSSEETRIHVHRWISLCDGSPRVAHLIGHNLRVNPEEVLAPLSTDNVWERFVVGQDDRNSPAVRQRWLVLRHIALFRRFGFRRPVSEEGEAIASIIRETDPTITYPLFCEIVCDLRERRILQGFGTLRIVPRALHVWLWLQWWEFYGGTFKFGEFLQDLPPDMLPWFAEMFSYAASREESRQVAESLLRPEFGLREEDLGSRYGVVLLVAISEACPQAGLSFLERLFENWTDDQIRSFRGRRSLVRALEMIVVWRKCFRRGANLLLRLAENETEPYSNNASGIVVSLFSPVLGRTEATFRERLHVLKESLLHPDIRRREIAIRVCKSALDTGSVMYRVGSEYQGLRRRPKPWIPRSYDEHIGALESIWSLLMEVLPKLEISEQKAISEIFIDRSLSLLADLEHPFQEAVLSTLEELSEDPANARSLICLYLDAVDRWRESLSDEVFNRLKNIHDGYIGDSVESQIHRYVGMNITSDFSSVNLNFREGMNQLKARLSNLARQCLEDPILLLDLLPWLCSRAAIRAELFGEALADLPKGMDWLPQVLETLETLGESRSPSLLVGFYKVLRRVDYTGWEQEITTMSNIASRRCWVMLLLRASGKLNEFVARTALALLENEDVSPVELIHWQWSSELNNIAQELFVSWVRALIKSEEGGTNAVALALLNTYLDNLDCNELPIAFPKSLIESLLSETILVDGDQDLRRNGSDWAKVALAFSQTYPKRALLLLSQALELLTNPKDFRNLIHTPLGGALSQIFTAQPLKAWRVVKELMSKCERQRYQLMRWLQGNALGFERRVHNGLIGLVPKAELWNWVEEDVQEHARLIAGYAPQTLTKEEGVFTRELLVRYGHIEAVKSALLANFGCTGWQGAAADHFRHLQLCAESWREQEEEPQVLQWIDEYIESLGSDIERSEMTDERR